MTKIVKLEAENIKRLRAIEITPDGHMVVVGGKNGQGKTSALDAIWYAVGGKAAMPSEPLRRGEEEGFARITLDNGIVVTRGITEDRTTLKVESDEGAVFKGPQAMLRKMVGPISFDPLEFARMGPKEQLETLRDLVGIDFTKIDGKREALYVERTDVNRAVKQLDSQLDRTTSWPDAAEEEVSVAALMEELKAAETQHFDHDTALHGINGLEEAISNRQRQMEELKRTIDEATEERHRLKLRAAKIKKAGLPDLEAIRSQISEADVTNSQVREEQQRTKLLGQLKRGQAKQKKLNAALTKLDDTKREKIAKAKFPVEGLAFGDDGVRFDDIPFEQCSSAEQTRVSVGMALAMNPELRVLLIRDGSLLDDDSFAMVSEMAEKADAQVWIETVSVDEKKCTVVIEDGAVVSA